MRTFLLHGLGSTPASMVYLQQELEDSYPISYNSHQRLEQSIRHVRQVIEDFIEPDEEYCLIGHSLGGLIAHHIAQHNPQVKKLITIASPLGGSKAAWLLQYAVIGSPIFADLVTSSWYVKHIKESRPPADVLSIIATEGGWSLFGEPNDGTVELRSQRALPYGEKVEVDANHFEVLLRLETLHAIKEFYDRF